MHKMLVRLPSWIPSPTRNNPFNSTLNPLHHQTSKTPPKTLKMEVTQFSAKRPICPSCSKPARLCLCTRIQYPGLANKVSVTILQHILERKHPLNSARIAKLGLKNVTVKTVSDVIFRARFFIRLLEPGLGRGSDQNECESSDFVQVLDLKDTQKRKFEYVYGFGSVRENLPDLGLEREQNSDMGNNNGEEKLVQNSGLLVSCGLVLEAENESRSNEFMSENGSFDVELPSTTLNEALLDDKNDVKHVAQGNEEPAITASIGKYGVIGDIKCTWMVQTHGKQRPNFNQILVSEGAVDALAKGFIVKRLQKRQWNGSLDLEEYEEFDLEVPSGSVLLFPSEKAVGVDELKAMNIEVKSLIVLDGTWAKARRMYEENPWLRLLPHLKLDLNKLSLYGEVRHQPKAGYLSTIESIVCALKAVGDNAEGLDNLLDVFESMIADQRRCKDERLNRVSAI